MDNGTVSASYNSTQFLGTGATASFRFTSQNSQLQFTSANSNFRFTSADSQLQFTSANSNFLGTGATASFRFTSADSQLQFTSANSNLLGTAATASFRFTSADSQLQFTSQMSDYLGTGATSDFQYTSQMTDYQATSLMTDYLGTGYTTHTHSQYVNTSATSAYQLIANSSLSLGTGATASFRFTSADSQLRFTSADSQLQFTSANSNFLGTGATASFRFTSADTQLRFTSADSQLRFTSADSQLQFTSANSNFLGTGATASFQFTSNTSAITSNALNTSVSRVINIVANTNSTAGGTTSLSSNVSFSAANGITFYTSAGGAIIANFNSANYQQTSATSAITSNAVNTSVTSNYQLIANSTLSLGTGATASFRFTSQNSQLVFSSAGLNLTNISATLGSGSISLSVGAYITTARASTDAVGLNTALTANGVSWTVNSSGISLNVPAFLTTAMLSNAATISNINVSGGTTSSNLSAFKFIDSQGVSWSLDTGSKVYATVKTDYQTSGAYLTTAMLSNAATISNINVSGGTTSSNLSAFKFIDSQGVSWSLDTGSKLYATVKTDYQTSGAYLTTAALSTQTNVFSLSGNTATTNSSIVSAGAYAFAGGNGVTLQMSNNTLSWSVATNYQSQGAYLTTARASTDAIGLNTAQSNVTWTINSSGLSFDGRGYAGIGTSATNASITLNSNGLAISVGAGGGVVPVGSASNGSFSFTTLAFSNANNVTFGTSAGSIITASVAAPGAGAGATVNGSTGAVSLTVASSLSFSSNGSTISFGLASNITTALQSAGNYLTTAALSTQTNVFSLSGNTATTNSSVVSAGAYAFAGGNGVTLQMSNNTLSWSVATNYQSQAAYLTTAMQSNAATLSNINISAGAAAANLSAFVLSNSNNATWGLNGSTVTISSPISISAGGANGNFTNIVFSNSNGVSFGLNGSTVTASVASVTVYTGYDPYHDMQWQTSQMGNGTLQMNVFSFPAFQCDRIYIPIFNTNATNSSGSHTVGISIGVYSRNASTMSLISSASVSVGATHSGTVGSYSILSGVRMVSMGFSSTFVEGQYFVAVASTSTSGGTNGTYALLCLSNFNAVGGNIGGYFGSSGTTSFQAVLGRGHLNAATSAIPGSINFNVLQGTNLQASRPPIFIFAYSTV